jgi:hypothetical protein
MKRNYGRSAGIATSYRLENLEITVHSPGMERGFPLFHSVKNNSRVPSVSNPMEVK